MMFCIAPIQFTESERLKFNLKADAIVVDSTTKFYCKSCYKKELRNNKDENQIFDSYTRYRAYEQVEMVQRETQTCIGVSKSERLDNQREIKGYENKDEKEELQLRIINLETLLKNNKSLLEGERSYA